MSPWSDQVVTITDSDGKVLSTKALTQSMKWEQIKIPSTTDQPKLFAKLRQIHSPQSQGTSPDQRRLGVALRAAR
jgi:hypothetical protein